VPLYPEVAVPDALSDVTKQKAQSRGPGFLHESLVGRDRFELSTYGLRVTSAANWQEYKFSKIKDLQW
jgi:hypothetical protein